MIKSSLIYLVGRYGASAITLVAISFYTRLVSPSEYGVYSLSFTAGTLLYSLFLFWLRDALIRFMPVYVEREHQLISQVAAGYVAVTALTGLVLIGVNLAPMRADAQRLATLSILIFLSLAFCEINLALLQSRFQPGRYALLSLMRTTTAGLTGSSLAWLGWGATGIVTGMVIGYVLCGLPVLIWTRRAIIWREVKWERFREVGFYGLSFSAAGALIALIAFVDRYIIAWMLGTEAAGHYSAPYDLASRILYVMMLAINLAGTPIIFKAYERGGLAEAELALRRQFVLLLSISLPVAVGLAIMSPFATGILLGQRFHEWGIALMPWVAAATVLQGIETFFFSFAFSLTRKPLGQTLVLVFIAMVNVALNLILIPLYGLVGAAVATVLTYVLGITGSWLAGRRLLAMPIPLGDGARIILAAALLGLVLWPWRLETGWLALLWSVGVALPVYAVALLVLNPGDLRGHARIVLGRRFGSRSPQSA